MNEIIAISISTILYGVTMKVADLLNEHGLKWFRGSAMVFGFAWGVFGSLVIILGGPIIANIVLAMNVAFIIRMRLDYLNHSLAATIIIICFLLSSAFNPIIFLIFYFIFLIFGSLKDYVGDVLQDNGKLVMLNEPMLYYSIPTLIYSFIFGDWMVFVTFTLFVIAYDVTKYIYFRKGYK